MSQVVASLAESLVENLRGSRLQAALFTTYTFGKRFFADEVRPLLASGGGDTSLVPITVVVDTDRFRGCGQGYETICAQVPIWHAKLILLMVAGPGGQDHRTIMAIGSANLTRKGWERNLEFVVVDTWSGWSIPGPIAAWLEFPWLRQSAFASWAREQAHQRYISRGNLGAAGILASHDIPLWDQVRWPSSQARWTEAHILAPFADMGGHGCDSPEPDPGGDDQGFYGKLLKRAHPQATLHIYLRGTVPDTGDARHGRQHAIGSVRVMQAVVKHGIRVIFHVVAPEHDRLLHAKIFAWYVGGSWTVVTGSPNASGAAWCRTIADGGNVELAWCFRTRRRTLPAGLFPRCPDLRLGDIAFIAPLFAHEQRWRAINSIEVIVRPHADLTTAKLRVHWLAGHSQRDTVILLDGRPLDPSRPRLDATADRSVEVRPRHPQDGRTWASSWVPIAIPFDVDDSGLVTAGLGPMDWIDLLAAPLEPCEPIEHLEEGVGEPRRTQHRRRHAEEAWSLAERTRRWRQSRLGLELSLGTVDAPRAATRLVRTMKGAWHAHDPQSAAAADRAWCCWIRAQLVAALARGLGRPRRVTRPLHELHRRWVKQVPSVLREFMHG